MSKNFIRLLILWVGILAPFALLVVALQGKKKKVATGPLPEKPFVVVIPSYAALADPLEEAL